MGPVPGIVRNPERQWRHAQAVVIEHGDRAARREGDRFDPRTTERPVVGRVTRTRPPERGAELRESIGPNPGAPALIGGGMNDMHQTTNLSTEVATF